MDDIRDEPALCGVTQSCAEAGSNGVWGEPALIDATAADADHDVIKIFKEGSTVDVTLNNGVWLNGLVVNIPLPTGEYTNIKVTAYDELIDGDVVQTTITPCVFNYTANSARAKKLTASMGYDLSDASYTGDTAHPYAHIYQSDPTATANTITIANGQNILLDGVNMLAQDTNAIVCEGDAKIVLVGTSTVRSHTTTGTLGKAVIKAGTYEPTKTTLTISGDGILNASPDYPSGAGTKTHDGAVIGADYQGTCGNIVINGGTITVSNSSCGAAIGSGRVANGTSRCGLITINGGTVNATSSAGAGIGTGARTSTGTGTTTCDGITINGGNVTARSAAGAAIGAGQSENKGNNSNVYCDNILITGGTIDARTSHADNAGAAIGGGFASKAGTITISGGNVIAVGSSYAAGIGAGSSNSQCGDILINGGSVDAQGGKGTKEGAGIGTGKGTGNTQKSVCGTITITSGVTVVKAYNTYGSNYRMNIGKGASSYTQCGTVKINETSGEIPGGSKYEYRP